MTPSLRAVPDSRPRLIVAGGGAGGIEAALALRSLVGDVCAVELICPEREFVYRAMSVAEPFGFAPPPPIALDGLGRRLNIRHRRDEVVAVDPGAVTVELASGALLDYDALVMAVGALREPWLDGSICFDGPAAVPAVRELLARVEAGEVERIVFTAGPAATWTLPLYELALMTASWCAEHGVTPPELHVVSSEAQPLALFGRAASRLLRDLAGDRGVTLTMEAEATGYAGGRLQLAGGRTLPADAVVTLPLLRGRRVRGLPWDAEGFIPVDDDGRVRGIEQVYAVGDGAARPVKQGGLAAQQADVAAACIARELGVNAAVPDSREVMRGMLLTGMAPAFLRAGDGPDAAGFSALWWPPTKIAGRHLSAYLADLHGVGDPDQLVDRPARDDLERAAQARAEMRALAMEMAKVDEQWGDYSSAARWLQTVEWLDGALPADLAARRDRWLAKSRR